jgi:glyoxylase-like metal-dependent hydrolase (beta-lactamase superfamily II)
MMVTAVLSRPGSGSLGRRPQVDAFFERRTCSVQYVVSDPATRRCALIDPVLDFDEKSGCTATSSADALLDFVCERDLSVEWILDTHPHADHFSAAGYLKDRTGAKTAIGERVVDVQRLWKQIYNLPDDFRPDGSQWDRLFADGEAFTIGELEASVLFSPGHTLASVTYVVGDAAFIHDTLFMPDFGTARCDFPGGDAGALWRSIQRILGLPDSTRLFSRPSARLGEHGRKPEDPQRPSQAGVLGGGVHRPPQGPGRHTSDAEADPAGLAGEHRGRAPAGTGGQRRP